MVRCVNCEKLDRKTRWCQTLKVRIKLKDIHKQLPCKHYALKLSEKEDLNKMEVQESNVNEKTL